MRQHWKVDPARLFRRALKLEDHMFSIKLVRRSSPARLS